MKFRHIIGMAIGAIIGIIMAYFGTGSMDVSNLFIGAIAGALVGLYLVTAATRRAGRTGASGPFKAG